MGKIPYEAAIKFFKKCCISNELDGTEDDALLATVKKILHVWILTRVLTFMMMYP